jgi:NADPH-dependent 2,4-dienoyl-CoA reductase/sulfur reductase-like enzyme
VSGAHDIVVIGGGPAGVFAAMAAKRQAPDATVVLLTEEPCEPYEKPPLSKAVLVGKAQAGDALIAGPKGLAGHGVVLRLSLRAVAIDRAERTIIVEDGRRICYDALVIATGSLVREIPQLPLGTPGVHYLRNEAQARALKAGIERGGRLLVIGGGLIGLEVAAAAAELGAKVTVLEMLPRILARVCDERTAAAVLATHLAHGVDVRTGTALAAAAETDDGLVVTTSAGDRIIADLVVVGTGATPDDRLAAAAGLVVDGGIVVDAQCRTSNAAIFAAGDVVRFPGPHGAVRLENWRHALDQGTIAGRNAAGGSDSYDTVPSFWSEQYDLYIQGVGWPAPATATSARRPLAAPAMLMFEIAEDRVVSAMGINAQRDIAAARRLIERRTVIDAGALADPAQPLAGLLKAKV